MVSLTPRQCRSAADSAIHGAADRHAGQRHRRSARPALAHRCSSSAGDGRGQAAEHQRALAADDDQAEPRRQGGAQRRQHQRRRARSACSASENQVPKRAVVHRAVEVERARAGQRDEDAEQR